ncbi:hypothetical protein [Lentzea californiensis]|uniref:hypothetical protein n=1 Tax=Lentzea californiensis TaxID=438851 RepID=UPI002164A673|nr:hypothetical protein [Lentzea californiensis]
MARSGVFLIVHTPGVFASDDRWIGLVWTEGVEPSGASARSGSRLPGMSARAPEADQE